MSGRIKRKTSSKEMSVVLTIFKDLTVIFAPSVLGHIRPALVFYGDVGGKIEIEFGARKIEPTELTDSLSKIQWMAPELFQKDSKPVSN